MAQARLKEDLPGFEYQQIQATWEEGNLRAVKLVQDVDEEVARDSGHLEPLQGLAETIGIPVMNTVEERHVVTIP